MKSLTRLHRELAFQSMDCSPKTVEPIGRRKFLMGNNFSSVDSWEPSTDNVQRGSMENHLTQHASNEVVDALIQGDARYPQNMMPVSESVKHILGNFALSGGDSFSGSFREAA